MPRVSIHSYLSVKDRDIVAIVRPVYMKPNERLYRLLNKQHAITGHWYGVFQVIGMAWCGLLIMCGIKPKRNPIRAGRDCTEDAYSFKRDAEREFCINENDGLQPDYIYPSQLLLTMIASNNYSLYIIKDDDMLLAEG
jgi:hypothetical protein